MQDGKETVDIKPREIKIYKIEFLEFVENKIKFLVECSKGTYIRTLCEDIANKIGTVGFLQDLERTKVDIFNINNSITIEELKNNTKSIQNKLITIEEVFKEKEKIELNERKKDLFLNGVMLSFENKDGVYRVYCQDQFIGLGLIKNKLLKRDVVVV